MKMLCRVSTAILLSCLICVPVWAGEMPVVAPEEVGLSSERLDRLTEVMEKGVEAGHFPGAVAAIARRGKIAYFEAYGYQDLDRSVPARTDAIFRIASMTKAITGVAVMILYEEGHFRLNDPVERYLPAFKDAQVAIDGKKDWGKKGKGKDKESKKDKDQWSKKDKDEWTEEEVAEWLEENKDKLSGEDWEKAKSADEESEPKTVPANSPITIRDLLRHTSGVASPGEGLYEEGMDLGQLIDRLGTFPLEFHPGTAWRYGLSMDVLARLVEVVSGMSYDVFLEERIFAPLGMKDTAYYVPKENHARLIEMFEQEGEGKKKSAKSAKATYLSPPAILMGGTGLVSTTMDYLRFCQMLLNNGEMEGKRILGRKAVELMHADHMGDIPLGYSDSKVGSEMRFGLTFGVKSAPGVTGELGSEGAYYWGGAYGTSFWIDPAEELVGVFMVNGAKYDKEDPVVYSQVFEHFTYQAIVD